MTEELTTKKTENIEFINFTYDETKKLNQEKLKIKQKDKMKKYYETNKEKINAKIKCELCGILYNKSNKKAHVESKKHDSAITKQQNAALKELLKNKL